jgi:RsiW-degrading membrane proteinase PrsW (M82 family)
MTPPLLDRPAAVSQRLPVVYRPGSAVFWLYVIAVLIGVVSLASDSGTAIHETLDAQIALSPIWLGFIVFLVWLILKFDPFRSVRPYPQGLIAGTVLGGTTALVMAMNGNDALSQVWARVLAPDALSQWSAALTAPFIEEASKAMCAAVILVLCAAVFNRISHALLVGKFVGFGFDVMEDLSYASNAALTNLDSDLSGAGPNLVLRIFTAIPAHWSYTSLSTVGVLLLLPSFHNRDSWSWPKRLNVAAILFASASFMHFVWDAPNPDDGGGALGVLLGKFVVNLAVFLTAVVLLLRSERRWVTDRIEAERCGVLADVNPEVLDSLLTGRRRRGLRRQARRNGGRKAGKLMRAQQNQVLDAIQTSSPTSSTRTE